jgi:ubiquinone/menaquinone biosynthesis C-methylase UbiE
MENKAIDKNLTLPFTGERAVTTLFDQTGVEHRHRYYMTMPWVKDKRVLDIACGEGYGSNLLSQTAREVIGVDIEDAVVKYASQKYASANVRFKQGSATLIPLPDHSVDVVVSFETLEHLTEHEKMLAEIKRVLIPGGMLIVSTPDKKYYTDEPKYHNPFHLKELYHNEFVSLVNLFFSNYIILNQRMFYASVVTAEKVYSGEIKLYSGDYYNGQITTSVKPYKHIYNIIIASDAEIKIDIPDTTFLEAFDIREYLLEFKSNFYTSWSYRLGHFLLLPFIKLKELIRSFSK